MIRPYGRALRWLVAAAAVLAALAVAGPALVVSSPIEAPDAIVSLASHEWERLPVAAALGLKYPHARILLTVPPVVNQHRCHDCAGRAAYLITRGVANQRIDLIPISESSTRGEARAIGAAIRERRLERVLIVTSAYHTRRALHTFRAILDANVAVGVEPAGIDQFAVPRRWWQRPYDRWYVRYEWAALIRDLARDLIGG